MARIAINTRLLIPDKIEGIGLFTLETVRYITRKHPEHQFFLIFDRKIKLPEEWDFSDNVRIISAGPMARHPFLYLFWFEIVIPFLLKRNNVDLFISPDGFISLSSGVPSLTVIHDLNFEHYPEFLPFIERNFYKFFFPKYARKAIGIATVSKFSARDIVESYKIDPSKIEVVYNGIDDSFKPLPIIEITRIRNTWSKGLPYFLFVGTLHERKNISNMLKAFDLFRKTSKEKYLFILAGRKMWWAKEMEEVYRSLQFREDVVFTGRLSDTELRSIYPAASALLYVPFFEGFGIPLLEAMSCEIPIITARSSSLPEIAGDAAIYTRPEDPVEISEKMMMIATDAALRNYLIANGRLRKQDFSWIKTSEKFWEFIERYIH